MTEINRKVNNNAEVEIGKSIYHKLILIQLQKIEGDENVQKFADKLQKALIGATQGGTIVKVDTNGTRKNEITVASITNCFPLRAIKDLPYLIAAYALGLVKYADKEDGTGKSAWGTISINRLGEEVLNPIADKFTEIPFKSELFTEKYGEELRENVENEIKANWLHKDKRAELVKKVQMLYKEVILPEYNNNKGHKDCKFLPTVQKKQWI
jgi:hypothetical protein